MQVKKFSISKAIRFGICFFGVAILATFFFTHSLSYFWPLLPRQDKPVILYSNQLSHSLKTVTLKAIESAQSSLLLHSFSLTDKTLLGLLIQKRKELSFFSIKTDLKPAPSFFPQLGPDLNWSRLPCSGLMHEKILVIDKKLCFLGTANMTTESLTMHDNVLIGIQSEKLAEFLHRFFEKKILKTEKSETFYINHQKLDLWMLPCKKEAALHDLIQKLSQSKKSIYVSMFTLTHNDVLQSLISAKNRGVSVNIFVDKSSSQGASKKAVEYLLSQGVKVYTSIGLQLLHHKMALIDDTILILGSANWTKSAFTKNKDFFLYLEPLTAEQRGSIKKIFQHIKKHAKRASV